MEIKIIIDYGGKKRVQIKNGRNRVDIVSKEQAESVAKEIIRLAEKAWPE